MNLDRLLPKTSFGRFFLINVISLALFWLLIQPMANYWRNQALFRMVASNESRLFLTHIRLLDKLPTIAERNGLFNPNDDVFSIRVCTCRRICRRTARTTRGACVDASSGHSSRKTSGIRTF